MAWTQQITAVIHFAAMSGWRLDAASKIGAKARHGPHQAAQKSTKTMPSFWIVAGKDWAVMAVVDMAMLLTR